MTYEISLLAGLIIIAGVIFLLADKFEDEIKQWWQDQKERNKERRLKEKSA